MYSKGDIETFSRDIYLIVSHKGLMSQLKNIRTGQVLSRLYHDEELGQTWSEVGGEASQRKRRASYEVNIEEEVGGESEKSKSKINLNLLDTIAKRRKPRIRKQVERLYL